MTDSYVETINQSYGSRIKSSFKAVIVGIIFVAISMGALIWVRFEAVLLLVLINLIQSLIHFFRCSKLRMNQTWSKLARLSKRVNLC